MVRFWFIFDAGFGVLLSSQKAASKRGGNPGGPFGSRGGSFGSFKKANKSMVFGPGLGILRPGKGMGSGSEKVENGKVTGAGTPSTEPPCSDAYQRGRRLVLRFNGEEAPILKRMEFRHRKEVTSDFRELNHPLNGFEWDKLAQALSLIFLEYLVWNQDGRPETFYFTGSSRDSLAASLGDALYKDNPFSDLICDPTSKNEKFFRLLFPGNNLAGKSPKQTERQISVSDHFLPPDCIQIFWDVRGTDALTKPVNFRLLVDRLRDSLRLPPIAPKVPTSPPEPEPEAAETEPAEPPPPKAGKKSFPRTATEMFAEDNSSASGNPGPPPVAVTRPIHPELFKVKPADWEWPDNAPLISLAEGVDWTLRNAFEGVFILGATGSGKTSGSGTTLAQSFLRSGFGALILTVKKNEAEHWRKLCAHCGREEDLVVVKRGGEAKLNILAYEAQRPGQGAGLSSNLVAFCRNLLSISTRSNGRVAGEKFWENATDQLLNATFDLFLLAGADLTFDNLADFVFSAPTNKKHTAGDDGQQTSAFEITFLKAKAHVKTDEDRRILKRTADYWFEIYPGLADETRTSITLGVYSLFDAFRGRDIPALISSDTTITPESIMSGKIVVLDLPLKEFGQTGLMIQSAWKYLFQMALERQSNAGDPSRRPVVLWEDEGQYFFSEHDHHFQDTARSARVSRVILSQNLHNFYKEFGDAGGAAANSVFGNLNTKVFHCNTDPNTNEWASKHFGKTLRTRFSTSSSPQQPPPQSGDFFSGFFNLFNGRASSTGSSTSEHWEPAVRPEEFNNLLNGGPQNDFCVEAYVTWPGLKTQDGQHFIRTTFIQNPDL